MFVHETQVRVRYSETDQMGFLYYGNYAQYYEVGRAEAIRSLGISYKSMETEMGIWMPVVSMSIRYVRPVLYDELLTIKTTLKKLPDQFVVFYNELYNEKGKITNAATVKLCFLDAQTKKTVKAPEALLEKLSCYFNTLPDKKEL